MNNVKIEYNPYTVETKFLLDGKEVDNKSNFFYKKENVRLQEWIEPFGDWKGLFEELFEHFNSSEKLHLEFKGTLLDFKDIEYAKEKYGKGIFKEIELVHIPAKNDENRIGLLKNQFNKIVNSPIEELKDKKISEAFTAAISSEFEIVVIAPMSSGKSTIINSILGRKILPEATKATTATVTRITDKDEYKEFLVTCKDNKGKKIAENKIADLKLITELNDIANKEKNIDLIDIKGNIPNIPSDEVNVVFVDTPGPNNAEDMHHREMMEKAIRNENSNIILFVFNPDSIQSTDCDSLLESIATTINTSSVGKRARDRIMFVCNKMSELDPDKESTEDILDKIKERLKGKGIYEPNIFLTDAMTCELIRMKELGIEMTESEEDDLDSGLKKFNRASRQLFKYSSISQEKIAEFNEEIEKFKGDNRNERVAEINSGIPALEYAITRYISKYAQAVKVKTMHDTFMKRVKELEMEAKVKKELAESNEKLNKTKEELEKKIEALEKDKKLEEFKRRIDSLKFDRSKTNKKVVELVEDLMKARYGYPDIVKKTELDICLNKFQKKILDVGEKIQESLRNSLEIDFYGQCKKIFNDYNAYIRELDRNGMLNIGSYSLKKLTAFKTISMNDLKNTTNNFATTVITGKVTKEKDGFINAIKRFFKISDGWYAEDKREDAVQFNRFAMQVLSKVQESFLQEVDMEINLAGEREKEMKNFVRKNLNEITATIRREFNEMNKLTHDKNLLNDMVEKNKKNKEWLEAFVGEVKSLLEI